MLLVQPSTLVCVGGGTAIDAESSRELTNAKWAAMTKASPDTALRDINDLIQRGILKRDSAGGRSTNYSLVVEILPKV